MENYRLVFKRSVAKDLRKIPNKEVKRILLRIESLSKNPTGEGCIKLSNQERYRVRQGVYRIIYEIKDLELVVQIVKISHRNEVYKSS